MPKLKHLSGKDIVYILSLFGFSIVSQRGSHIKMARQLETGERQILTIPNHVELDTGTCRAILRQASQYIPVEQLKNYFYS